MASDIAVMSPSFCNPKEVALFIRRKPSDTRGNFEVDDQKANTLFKVKDMMLSRNDRDPPVLFEHNNRTINNFRTKGVGAHRQWDVFNGNGSASSDLLFTVKKSRFVQGQVDVFLPGNGDEYSCDFKVYGSWSERLINVFKGSSVITKMHSEDIGIPGEETYVLYVNPKVDIAFISAIMILHFDLTQD